MNYALKKYNQPLGLNNIIFHKAIKENYIFVKKEFVPTLP